MTPKDKVQINPYVPKDLKKQIDTLVKTRGVAISDITTAALQAYFAPEEDRDGAGPLQGLALRRLERLTQTLHLALQHLDMLGEAVGMLARVYLSTTCALPEAERAQARREGGARYRAYIEAIAARLRQGQTLLNDLPDDLFRRETPETPSSPEGVDLC